MNHHEVLHKKAIDTADHYLRSESAMISILQELDREKTYLYYKESSLFQYALKFLKLGESAAYTLIGIARKSVQVPELKAAIADQRLDVSNARRILSVLTPQNQSAWIAKASVLPQAKLDRELAIQFPERAASSKVKYKSEHLARLEVDLSHRTLELLRRTQDLLSQKHSRAVDRAEALETALAELVNRLDPERKAARAEDRLKKKSLAGDQAQLPEKKTSGETGQSQLVLKRVPLPAALKHKIILRDQNQCTEILSDQTRCPSRRWLDIHHIKPISQGGTNSPDNLRTLCSAHHRMIHGMNDEHSAQV